MSRKWIVTLCAVGWAAQAIFSYGAVFADQSAAWYNNDCWYTKRDRRLAAESAGFAVIPVAFLLSPFLTGFYEHGFRFIPLEYRYCGTLKSAKDAARAYESTKENKQ